MPQYRLNKRDANEAALIELARRLGWEVVQMPGTVGFDLLLTKDGVIRICEVKMPGKQNNLTDNERKTRAAFERAGTNYPVVINAEQMAELLQFAEMLR